MNCENRDNFTEPFSNGIHYLNYPRFGLTAELSHSCEVTVRKVAHQRTIIGKSENERFPAHCLKVVEQFLVYVE